MLCGWKRPTWSPTSSRSPVTKAAVARVPAVAVASKNGAKAEADVVRAAKVVEEIATAIVDRAVKVVDQIAIVDRVEKAAEIVDRAEKGRIAMEIADRANTRVEAISIVIVI